MTENLLYIKKKTTCVSCSLKTKDRGVKTAQLNWAERQEQEQSAENVNTVSSFCTEKSWKTCEHTGISRVFWDGSFEFCFQCKLTESWIRCKIVHYIYNFYLHINIIYARFIQRVTVFNKLVT